MVNGTVMYLNEWLLSVRELCRPIDWISNDTEV